MITSTSNSTVTVNLTVTVTITIAIIITMAITITIYINVTVASTITVTVTNYYHYYHYVYSYYPCSPDAPATAIATRRGAISCGPTCHGQTQREVVSGLRSLLSPSCSKQGSSATKQSLHPMA